MKTKTDIQTRLARIASSRAALAAQYRDAEAANELRRVFGRK
jgi:hypothetical protein